MSILYKKVLNKLNMNQEKERLRYTISRLDHYYDSINNKSAVYITINTFITGGLMVLLTETEYLEKVSCIYIIILLLCLFCGIISLIILAYNSIPFHPKDSKSLHYFGAIASYTPKDFCKKSIKCSPKKEITDLRHQVHNLSTGLNVKFKRLLFVGVLLIIQFILQIPIIISLIINN